MSRLFFALWPEESTRRALADLARPAPAGSRPVLPANLHITLVFLGSVNSEQEAVLVAGADRVDCPPFTLSIDNLGWWRRPRIIQASPSRTPEPLQQLVRSLQQLAEECGIPIDRRPYRPHITLARKVKSADALSQPVPVQWPVDNYCLVRSDTLPEGVCYQVIWRRYR